MDKIKVRRDEQTGRWFMDGVEDEKITYARIIDNLKSHRPFKFSRYGDGEWNCIFNKQGVNCDGHKYFPDLGQSLRRVILSEPKYIVGMQPLSMSYERSEQIKQLCTGLKINWVNADVLHNASIDRVLDKFIFSLDGRYIILVGPPHLYNFFNHCVHIAIPTVNCWLEYENVRQQIEFHIEGVNDAVVLLAASMMSNVIVDDFAGYPHTFIDVGSVFDPYCNVRSRRYHHKLKI